MTIFKPTDVDFSNKTETRKPDGTVETTERKIKLGTEDEIVIFCGIIAVIFAFGMLFKWVPINELTIGVVGFSGIGTVVAEIIKAKKEKKRESKDNSGGK